MIANQLVMCLDVNGLPPLSCQVFGVTILPRHQWFVFYLTYVVQWTMVK